ncbi:hypothetical protein [Rhodoferax ferrireducens]|uniref:hypothetical protein n=1 Tax=Rhodoferax ferrireducens TaxID=192843 RepID=UPI00140F5DF6|nr:hypothetical protein [Rhodoferax ferrireducens]
MLARKTYDATAIGAAGTMTYGGASQMDGGYERFATHIADLEAMEANGMVRIEYRHHESGTGDRHVDLVRFTRLK